MSGVGSVEVRLLGPVELRIGEATVPVRSRKQRAILAVLALEVGKTVSTGRLIDALWGESPPPAARNSLEAHVSRLRKLLGGHGCAADALRTQSPGYALQAGTDLTLFECMRADASTLIAAGNTVTAAEKLDAALALWRGHPLADLADEPFAQLESARLEELRLAGREELIRCRLALGEAGPAIPELEALVAAYPLREGFRELLMRALYSADRQADALALYRETRKLFRDELGIDPGPALQELERSILRHDPKIRTESPRRPVPAQLPPTDRPRDRRTRGRLLIAAGVVAAAAGAVALGLIVTTGSGARRLLHPQPLGKHLLASISSPLPSCCAFGFGGVWVVGHHDETVQKIDPTTRKIVASYHIAGYQAEAPIIAAGSLWVPAAGEWRFVRFDPVRKRIVAIYPTTAAEIAWGYNSIWATTRDHQLIRINLRTNKIASRLRLSAGLNDFDDGIAIGYGSIWITNTDNAALLRVDPVANRITGTITGFGSTDSWMPVTVGDGSVWVYRITGDQGVVYRIDPNTNQIVKRIPVGLTNAAWPNGYMLDAGGYVWTCDAENTMSQIDPASNRVVGWYSVPESCQEVAYGLGSIWTALYDHSLVYRIDPTP